jgi:zinc protease
VTVEGYDLCWQSGLKVHVVRRPGSHVASVAAVVGGGERAEAEDAAGAAHLVEHLWFLSRPEGEASVEQVLAGVEYQGFTLPDATVYLTTAATSALEPLLRLEALRLADPLRGIGREDLELAQKLIRSELVWRTGDVVDRAWAGEVLSVADASTPVSGGSALGQLRAYANAVYRPELTTLRIEADIEPSSLQDIMRRAFPPELLAGDRRSCEHRSSTAPPAQPTPPALTHVVAPVPRRALAFGWRAPAGFGAQDAFGLMGAHWLGWTMPEVVGAAPRMGDEASSLSCFYVPGGSESLVVCVTFLGEMADAEGVADRVRRHVRRQWASALDADTIRFPREFALLDALSQMSSIDDDSLLSRALYSHFSDEAVDPTGPLSRNVRGMSAGALADWGRVWITSDRMIAVVVEPGFSDAVDTTRFAGVPILEPPPRTPWEAPRPNLQAWNVTTLPTGLDVWTLPFPEPLTYSQLVFDGGRASGLTGAAIAHELTSYPDYAFDGLYYMLMTTTAPAWSAVDVGVTTTSDFGLPANLDVQLYAIRVSTTEREQSGSPRALLNKKHVTDALAGAFDDFDIVVLDRSLAALFPGHPLGIPQWEHVAALRNLTGSDARAWRAEVFRPDRAALLVGGNVRVDAVANSALTYFGSWLTPAEPLTPAAPLAAPAARRVFGIEAAATLGSLRIACELSGAGLDDAAGDVAGVLAERAVSQTLRDQGGLYGLGASTMDLGPQARVLLLSADVPPAAAAAASDALSGVLDTLALGVSEDLLAWARHVVLTRYARATSVAQPSMDLAARATVDGLTLDALRAYPDRVDGVDSAAIRAVMKDCAGQEVVTWVGPRIELPGATWQRKEDVLLSLREGW